MKTLDPRVKKAIDIALYILPLLAVVALGGRSYQKVNQNVKSIDNHAFIIHDMGSCVNNNRNDITSIQVMSEERYDKLILLMETQHDTMKEMKVDISIMRGDIGSLKIAIACLKNDVSNLKNENK